jgi:uncharacterized membrane protein (DUF2068 family)
MQPGLNAPPTDTNSGNMSMMTGRSASLLPWIVAFKALKSVLLTALGVTVLSTIHRDPVDLVVRIAQAVHLPVTSRLFDRAVTLASRATHRKEVAVAATAFGYAVVMGIEGVGLYLRRSWARWFTIGATGSLIPLEVYEIIREPRPLRMLVLLLNAGVVVYLWRRKEVFE